MRLKFKNRKAQSTLEFCLCIPIVLFVVLGTVDIARMNIIKMETSMIMQQELSRAMTGQYPQGMVQSVKNANTRLANEAFFCTVTNVRGKSCEYEITKHDIKTEITSSPTGGTKKSGGTICMKAVSTFDPFYSDLYGKTVTISTTTCSIAETEVKLANR